MTENALYEVEIARPDVPLHVLRAVTTTYRDTALDPSGRIAGYAPVERGVIEADLDFWMANPTIPAENVCSRMDNYYPKSESQHKLLKAAAFMVEHGAAARAMGLFAHGEPGLGKTHIAVALAKALVARGAGAVTYHNASTEKILPSRDEDYEAMADQGRGVIILDDVKESYGSPASALRAAISALHTCGGRLFVTSNTDDSTRFLARALRPAGSSEADAEFLRLNDRMQSMMHTLHLQGVSHRSTVNNAWSGFAG